MATSKPRGNPTRQVLKTVRGADQAAEEMAEPYRDGLAFQAASKFSEMADQPEMRALSAALVGAGLIAGNERLARAGARLLAAHEVATFIKNMVKDNIDRPRPRSAGGAGARQPKPGRKHDKELTSFPSGHSAGAVAGALAFSREYPAARPVALMLAAVAAVVQVPRRAHYLSDVVAGVAIGIAAEALTNGISRAVSGKS